MNCREFIIEFEDRAALSETATRHLTICADCRQKSDRQTRVWLMIDRLERVAAPPDFDFHVKAKIANAAPSDFKTPRFLPVLRYVLPLSVVVLLLSLFIFNSPYFSDRQISPPVVQKINELPNVKADLPVDSAASNQPAFVESDEKKSVAALPSPNGDLPFNRRNVQIAKVQPKERGKIPARSIDSDAGGSSRVDSYTKTATFTPAGINLNANVANAPKIESPKQASDEQILSFFGVETVLENGKRIVKALPEDVAGRSGIRIGDVIETVKGDSLTVLRGTEKIEITLQNKVNKPR